MKRLPLIILLCLAADCFGQAFMANRRKAFQPVASLPSDIANLELWLKSESITGSNGDRLTSWMDSSGNNRSPTNGATASPYVTNNVLNGTFEAIRFTGLGVNWILECPPSANGIARNKTGATGFIVLRRVAAVNTSYGLHISRNAAISTRLAVPYETSTTSLLAIGGRRTDADGFTTSDAVAFPPNWLQIEEEIDWANSAARMWTNGVLAINDTSYTTDGSTSDTDSVAVTIGAYRGSGSCNFEIAEILYYSRKLTDAERGIVSVYLDNKFNLIP